jgi:periplasmic protein TonB
MGYQVLLFCPDEKLSSVVSEVFVELDFVVEAVQEPFAAVKKLMAQHYDAIVVDSENEQNASLLFKSAKNSSSNHNSLAIALVEGQAGIAKAYRIGANLVLTKPINVEQAKGTLRVARGLLRKNSEASDARPGSLPVPVTPASPMSGAALGTPLPAMVSEPGQRDFSQMTASAKIDDKLAIPPAATPNRISIAAEDVTTQRPSSLTVTAGVHDKDDAANNGIGNAVKGEAGMHLAISNSIPTQKAASDSPLFRGSAAAPAPAKEATVAPSGSNRIVESVSADSSDENPSRAGTAIAASSSVKAADAPHFAESGKDSDRSGANTKMLIAAAIVLGLAALGYLGYGFLVKSSPTVALQHVSVLPDKAAAAPVPAPVIAEVATPSSSAPDPAAAGIQNSAPKTATTTPSAIPPSVADNAPAIRIASNTSANPTRESQMQGSAPLLVKSNPTRQRMPKGEESAPQLRGSVAVASSSENTLRGMMSSAPSSLPQLSLTTLKISQGVSEGLLLKRVQPKYPQAALAIHAQGTVRIEATINKEGVVTNPRVLAGDAVLAEAALEAVRQWRYKPYYLDGKPVEIQTQITVNFRRN